MAIVNESSGRLLREQRMNRVLSIVIVCVSVVSLGLMGLVYAVSRPVQIDLPPSLDQFVTLNSSDRYSHSIYGFASMVFQNVNYWPYDGEVDYKKKIYSVRPLVTDSFNEWLSLDYLRKSKGQNINELRSRTKTVQVSGDEVYRKGSVKKLGAGTWEVELILDIKEELAELPIKHYKGRFVVRVVDHRVSKEFNPWQLALDGNPKEIERLETYIKETE